MNKFQTFALISVLSSACPILWGWTHGLRTFTAEGARRLEVEGRHLPLPDVILEDSRHHVFHFDAYKGSWVLVEFIYTRCPTICSTLGLAFKRISATLLNSEQRQGVILLSISFDPEHDTPEALKRYEEIYGVDRQVWRLARVKERKELARLLTAFGVVVIPDQFGGFEHNAAIHLINPEGLLVRIYDYSSVNQIISDLASLSRGD